MEDIHKNVHQNIRRYDYPEWSLPALVGFISAKSYYESKVLPLVAKLKDTPKKMSAQFTVMENKIKSLTELVNLYKNRVSKLVGELIEKDKKIEKLQEKADDLERVKRYAGVEQIDKFIEMEIQQESLNKPECIHERYR